MADDQDGYTHGAMDIADQKRTFDGFMRVTVWGSGLTAVLVLYLTLVFAAGMDAFGSLAVATILGVLIGLGLRLSGVWYATIIGSAVITGIITVLVQLLHAVAG